MRTFAHHEHKHELHGITVVVETDGDLWVGRCDDIVAEGVILKDADRHREGESTAPRADWLTRARDVGVYPNHRHVLVPAATVVMVRRLTES